MSVTSGGEVEGRSEAEQRVLDAISSGGVADFSELPVQSRQLPATFLEELIAGVGADLPLLSGRLPARVRR